MTIPDTLILNTAAVARLNWQPRYCPPPLECFASRRGDILQLVFGVSQDAISRPITAPRFHYQLTPRTDTTVHATLIHHQQETTRHA